MVEVVLLLMLLLQILIRAFRGIVDEVSLIFVVLPPVAADAGTWYCHTYPQSPIV